MSAGIFVAAGSRMQRLNGDSGTAEELAADILRLNKRQSDAAVTRALCSISGPLMDWLLAQGVPIEHMPDYVYPGMSHSWLHSPPQRDGSVITGALLDRIKQQPAIDLHLQTRVTGLRADVSGINGLTAETTDGKVLTVHAKAVILAASGFAANPSLVAQYIPEFAGAPYYGAPFVTGDAIQWGQEMGAAVENMSAYQAHSSIAYPKMMLVTTYLINHGAIQVNKHGRRFGDETDTYARHALAVQAQPDRTVVEVFDRHILEKTLANYPRFGECLSAGIVMEAETVKQLARHFNLDGAGLEDTIANYNAALHAGKDEYGRTKFGAPLAPPFYGIRVTSALVQTLGGLRVNEKARVMRAAGAAIRGLFAGGGTATGLAGDQPQGYLAGTGLLTAFGLGWIAGRNAANL